MELRQLEYFLAIVEHEGLGRAAERLHLSQPALSQSIRALERELQVSLFHRTGRRLAPTPTGLELVPLARRVLADVVDARDAMTRARDVEGGALSVVCTPEMSSEAVAAWSAGFTRRHPAVRLDISEVDSTADLLDAIHGGRAELGFTVAHDELEGVSFVRLGVQRLLLVRSPNAPVAAASEPIPLADIGDLPLVIRQVASRENDVVRAALAEHGADVTVGATVPSRAAQLTFVLHAGFQAFLPLRMCVTALDGGATVVETKPMLTAPFGVVHRSAALGPAAQAFLQEVHSELRRWYDGIDERRRAGAGLVEAAVAAGRSISDDGRTQVDP